MSDKFGRHQSTRWVKASVPSYGDDWNDDYEYGSGSGSENGVDEVRSPDLNDVKAERFVLPEENIVDATTKKSEIPSVDHETGKKEPVKESLILSIDNLQKTHIDEDDEDEEEDSEGETNNKIHNQNEKSIGQESTGEHTLKNDASNNGVSKEYSQDQFNGLESKRSTVRKSPIPFDDAPITNTVLTHPKQEPILPPTPVYGTNDTKYSQPETPMSERSFQSDADSIQNEPTNLRVASLHKKDSSISNDIIKEHPEISKEETVSGESALESPKDLPDEKSNSNLVLSIDKKIFDDSSDSEDDPIPYYEKENPSREPEEDSDKDEAIDSFINDLQNFSVDNKSSKTNDYSYYDYDYNDVDDDEDLDNVTPIAPLSTADEKLYHEKYINELTGHKPSIRKPPKSMNVEEPLDSPSYSTFGDAVDAYMSDDKSEDTFDTVDGGKEIEEEGPKEVSRSPSPKLKEMDALDPPELHPVASTGSLSTGKFSLEQKSEFTDPASAHDKDIGRRDSTMSTNTFNMGGWKPNTNNFRDQFINDIDNDSNYNFSMDNESINGNAGYQKFTKLREVSTASDNMSFASSAASIPETVDIPLPSINEDPDDNDDTFTSSHDTSNDSNKGLGIITTSKDSILNEHEYSQGKFDEDFSSKESLTTKKQQKYSSLLAPIADDDRSTMMETSRSSSSETAPSRDVSSSIAPTTSLTPKSRLMSESTSIGSTLTTKTFPPNAYPVSNWKTIMKPSQTIDRISLLKDALEKECTYDTGLQTWLSETLTKSDNSSNIHIGKIASQAYQNAAHNDLRRHVSIRSRVSSVRDKVENGGIHASNLGKKFFSRSKKLMRSNS